MFPLPLCAAYQTQKNLHMHVMGQQQHMKIRLPEQNPVIKNGVQLS
jgi:hypothetical protein